ncbi:MAG: YceI family protein [Bacteroidetes bacterium]|nr:YceI family protein [Bacteroidota bacterium]
MEKKTAILGVLMLIVLSVSAQKTKWAFDKAHSKIQFDVSHMVISEVSGQFQDYEGTVLADKADFSDAKIEFSIDVKSIDTDNEKRDGHLRSADFFDADKYPKITFKSKSIKKAGDNKYKLTGELTMHGVTKTVTLDMKYGGTAKDSYGNIKAGFKITGTIDRTDFGLKYNSVMESGGLLIGEEITIICKVELLKQK